MITEGQFEALICAIHKAAADVSLWPAALRLLAEACDASKTVLVQQGKSSGEISSIAPFREPAHAERYRRYYHRVNPLWQRAASAPAGTVQTDEMIIPRDEFIQTEFYNDFLIPQGLGSVLRTVAHVENGRQTIIAAHRQRAFDTQDIQLFERLTPHLQRAVEINVILANLHMNSKACAEALNQLEHGVLFVDEDGGVVFANDEADRLFTAGVLRLVDGNLSALSVAETKQLRALIAECAQNDIEADVGHTFSLARERSDMPVSLQVMPLRLELDPIFLSARPVAIIFASDPDRKTKQLISKITKQFGLTAAEAAVAREILTGRGLQAAADRLKVTRATARTHLAHVFAKTGTKRQAELVHLLLQQRQGGADSVGPDQ